MRVLWITAVTVLIDQITKAIVLHTMYRGQSIPVLGDWLKFTFTENPGMAFGLTFGPKAFVTIASLVATTLIIVYLFRVQDSYWPYRASLALILGGALGNIIDRVFYGVLLGYDTFFVGKVVDFIQVDLWSGYISELVPVIGGAYVSLFPIWNVADMAIVGGVVGILIYQKRYHEQLMAEQEAAAAAGAEAPVSVVAVDGAEPSGPAEEGPAPAPEVPERSDEPRRP